MKQASRRQTWAAPANGIIRTSFDIASRTGRWEGSEFVEGSGRAAQIYVFAYHAIDDERADHRDPSQWQFFVVPTAKLPETKRISLSGVKQLALSSSISALPSAVEATATEILARASAEAPDCSSD